MLRSALMVAIAAVSATVALAQPAPPVRVVAEWEPASGTLISWPLGIPQALVEELARDDMLYVLVTGAGAENQARQTFDSWNIQPAHLDFIHTSVQTHWPRDWGPHQIFDGDGEWAIVDPIFEGYPWVPAECLPIDSPGGHAGDNAVNPDVAEHFGAPLHTLPAYLTGGNFLVDGHEAAFSTCAMVGENEQIWSEAQFLDLAAEYLGVLDYQITDNTEDWGIQHIDCWLKVIDEETLLVKRPPVWHEEYDRIQTSLERIARSTTRYGRPWRVFRIDTPPFDGYNVAAYTNSLILNQKVLVPLFDIPGDAEAIATFERAMPGYEVIGFPWGGWYHYDALHCRARAIFDRHMLRITHRRLAAWMPVAGDHEVRAFIDDRSEVGLSPGALRVYWREAGSIQWSWANLTPTPEPDTYAAAIPEQEPGTTVQYYLAAADQFGRAETLPRTAPEGSYAFTVGCAPIALAVERSELSWTGLAGASGYDVVGGDLGTLRATKGDFLQAVTGCLADDHESTTLPHTVDPFVGNGSWFLVRGLSDSGPTSYGHAADCERTTRDALIDVAATACP